MSDDDAAAARRTFGEALFDMRRTRGFTFTQLQDMCGILVAQQETWESGDDLPSPYDLTTILRELDLGPTRNRNVQALFKRAREMTDVEQEREAFELLARNQASTRASADRSPSVDLVNSWLAADPPKASSRRGRGIFISYRRADSVHMAGRLYDRLAARFGEDRVFIDVDTIDVGVDFAKAIDAAVGRADVVLVLIGRDWLTATDNNGRRRIDSPDDLVRHEIETALTRGIRTVPVLIDGVRMPAGSELPRSLAPLVRRNAISLNHASFSNDVSQLVAALARLLDGQAE